MNEKDKQASSEENKEITGSEWDDDINAQGLNAQNLPSKSFEQNRALRKLISEISQPSWLKISANKHELPREGYKEVTEVTTQEINLRLTRKIQNREIDPKKGSVSRYVRSIKPHIVKKTKNDYLGKHSFVKQGTKKWVKTVSIYTPMSNSESGHTDESYVLLDILKPSETAPWLSKQIVDCIREDPERLFRCRHMRKLPKANFRAIALLRVDGYEWQEIADCLGTKLKATARFHDRCLQEFAPKIREYLQS